MKEERTTYNRLKLLPALFRKQDAEKVAPHTNTFLSRALRKGLIYRISRGHYVNSFLYGFASTEEVACFLKPPAYISCEWALNFHGISLQSPLVCTAITLSTSVGKKRKVQYQGTTIEFSKISSSLFFGFEYRDRFYMAVPEKAILDTIYYRGIIPAVDELEIDEVDFKLLLRMTGKYPSSVGRSLQKLPILGGKVKEMIS